jgi:hypothetical protein
MPTHIAPDHDYITFALSRIRRANNLLVVELGAEIPDRCKVALVWLADAREALIKAMHESAA